jgi:RNA polymerase sigma-70 factor (ECF subfamily)
MSTPDIQAAASRWVDDHGECLYRYALVRVRRPEVAEDLVQEALLAAVRGYEKFGGRSSERSWLVGILKNKIVDHFRKLGRETSFTDMEFLSDEFPEKFVSIGFWNHDLGPHEWKPRAGRSNASQRVLAGDARLFLKAAGKDPRCFHDA